jgi:hypothetical protein
MHMKLWTVIFCLAAGFLYAEEAGTNFNAAAVLERTRAHRVLTDLSLKARLFVSRAEIVEVTMLVKNTPSEARTIYRTGATDLLVIQPVAGAPRWFLKGAGELTGEKLLEKFARSQFTFYDLGAPFLQWSNATAAGLDRYRGRNCYLVELTAEGQPYRRAKVWLDQEFFGMVRAELYDANDGLARRLTITSFKRVGEVWIPRGIDMAFVPPRQALPAEEKSRLEIYEGNYDAQLPAEWFAETAYAAPPP